MYAIKDFEYLFSQPATGIEDLRFGEVDNHRVKTIKSGPIMLEVEIIRTFKSKSDARRRSGQPKPTPEEQKAVNERNARKSFVRRANTNFGPEDIMVTLTYAAPVTMTAARKDITNYLRRVKRARKAVDLPELKYMYVVESNVDEETGEISPKRVHHHIIMSGMDRDEAERLWPYGYANARRLQLDENGISGLAHYMLKDPRGNKRWCCSKNLAEPIITTADKKISKRQVEKIATETELAGKEIFEKFYPDYRLTSVEVRRSDFAAGVYIYAKMSRKPKSDIRTPQTRTHTRTPAGEISNQKGRKENGAIQRAQRLSMSAMQADIEN